MDITVGGKEAPGIPLQRNYRTSVSVKLWNNRFINQLKKNWMKDLKAYGLYILEKLVSKRLASTMSEQSRMALAMKKLEKVSNLITKRFKFKVLKLILSNMALLGGVMRGGKMSTMLNHLSATTISGNWFKKKNCQIGLRMQVRNNQIQLCLGLRKLRQKLKLMRCWGG